MGPLAKLQAACLNCHLETLAAKGDWRAATQAGFASIYPKMEPGKLWKVIFDLYNVYATFIYPDVMKNIRYDITTLGAPRSMRNEIKCLLLPYVSEYSARQTHSFL